MYLDTITVLQKKSVAPITRHMREMRAHLTLTWEMGATLLDLSKI